MNRVSNHLQEINMIGQLADLKDSNYKNTLVMTALIELLIEKGLLTRKEILQKTNALETDLMNDLLRQIDIR